MINSTVSPLIIYTKKLLNSDWLKTQKKPTRTNQIKAVLTTQIQENGHGFQQTTTGFNFVSKTTIESLKKNSKNMNTVKSTSFWLNVLKMRYEEKNTGLSNRVGLRDKGERSDEFTFGQ